MTIQIADRVKRIHPSATLAVGARAAAMKKAGKDVLNLSLGEPDFDTPDFIKDAAIKAIEQGFTKYTPVSGIPELKEAIAQKFLKDNQLTYSPSQVIVTAGAKQAIYNAAQAILNPGDEAIIPSPYWVSYPDIVALAGATPVYIKTSISENFKITPETLRAHLTPKTRLFILNSPSNPSGMMYSREELSKLAEVLLEYPKVCILSDDIYEHIVWPGEAFSNIVTVCPELYERTLVVNGASKSYAMTGWRIGYAAGPENLIKEMDKIQSQSTSNPNSIAQKAVVVGMNGDQLFIRDMNKHFKERHDFVVESLNSILGITCLAGNGTFYAFPDVSELLHANKQFTSDIALCEYLLVRAGVAVVPGSAFGSDTCIRISFASSMSTLQDGMERIKTVFTSLS